MTKNILLLPIKTSLSLMIIKDNLIQEILLLRLFFFHLQERIIYIMLSLLSFSNLLFNPLNITYINDFLVKLGMRSSLPTDLLQLLD